jgi:hypothetical protein
MFGKTFIGFAIVRQIVSQSDTDRVVFVCPNKAIANMCFVEIASRFEKRYSSTSTVCQTLVSMFIRAVAGYGAAAHGAGA